MAHSGAAAFTWPGFVSKQGACLTWPAWHIQIHSQGGATSFQHLQGLAVQPRKGAVAQLKVTLLKGSQQSILGALYATQGQE